MNRAAFLDRDGVINRKAREGEYITRWEDMQILSGVTEAIGLLNRNDFRVIVVSNQRCVAKGIVNKADLEMLHLRMRDYLKESRAIIDAIYYCPHEHSQCNCRKPAPGMLFAAARDHAVDLASSWMIGDSDHDTAAGRNAGCKTVRLTASQNIAADSADLGATSLLDAVQQILSAEEAAAVRATSYGPVF